MVMTMTIMMIELPTDIVIVMVLMMLAYGHNSQVDKSHDGGCVEVIVSW